MAVIGLGLDICAVARIQRILDGPLAERFLARVFTPAERALCSGRANAAEAYAARFAAKEALMKALGAPLGIRWRDMEIVREEGAPRFVLSGVAEEIMSRRGLVALLAVTHDAGVAAATVLVQERG